ncbi:MAG: replication initiation protein [Gammaproteobacteria bacterium]|nr:replication initiation protein [Gammaproteobacteria bacterium]
MGIVENKEQKNLLKHVSAIHSAAPLTLLQRKINNALLFHAYPMLTKSEEHTITMTELCRMIGYEGHNYDALKDAILGLLNTVIQWNIIGDDCNDEVWRAGAIISFVEMKKSVCTYYYSKPLRELLYEPSVYGRISMIVQARFSSVYALALYENCARYITTKVTKWFDYEIFRKLMGIMDDTKYTVFKDFKKRVIDKAVSEINLRSSIEVLPEYRTAGRKVIAIRFKVNEKNKKAPLGRRTSKNYDELENNERALIDILQQEFNISSSHGIKLLREYGEEDVLKKMDILKKTKAYKIGQIQGPAYLISLLKNNAQSPAALEKMSDIIKQRDQQSIHSENEQHDVQAKKKQDHYKHLIKQFEALLDSLDDEEKNALLGEFIQDQVNKKLDFVVSEYRKNGLKSVIVQNMFLRYFKEQYPDRMDALTTGV